MGAHESRPIVETKDVEMSRRFYIETSADGHHQFVKLKRSRSHHDPGHHHHHHRRRHSHHPEDHHHHHHAPYDSDHYLIRKDEWDILKERDRILTDNNKILTTENQDLRAALADSQAEAHRLAHMVVPDLQCQVAALQSDNAGLRRSLDTAAEHAEKHHREVDRLQTRVEKLEREGRDLRDVNADLRSRIKALKDQLDGSCNRRIADLTREVHYWKDQTRHWKCRFEDLADRLEFRTQRVDPFDDILKRRTVV